MRRLSPQSVPWLVAGLLLIGLFAMARRQHQWLNELATTDRVRREHQMAQGLDGFRRAFDGDLFAGHFDLQQAAYGLETTGQLDWRHLSPFREAVLQVYRGRHDGDQWRWALLHPLDEPAPVDRTAAYAASRYPLELAGPQVPLVLDHAHLALDSYVLSMRSFSDDVMRAVAGQRGRPRLMPQSALLLILDRDRYFTERVRGLIEQHLPRVDRIDYAMIEETLAARTVIARGRVRVSRVGHDQARPDRRFDVRGLTDDQWLATPPDQAVRLLANPDITHALGEAYPMAEDLARQESAGQAVRRPKYPFVIATKPFDRFWTLEVRFRGGPVSAELERLRRRNLLVSSITTAALAASILLLVGSTARSQRLARSRLDFVHGVSHELRTPLSVLTAAGTNLTDGTVTSGDRIAEYGHLIRRESQRLSGWVERVLTVARLDEIARETHAVDLARVVSRVTEASRMEWEPLGLVVLNRVPASTPHVEANASALESALRNLLDNAIKYGADGGRIEIHAETTGTSGSARVRIGVRDWGPGVDPRDRDRLFDPFFRARRARDAPMAGTGLGLDLVARMARASGGRVGYENHASGGCTFSLHWPVAAAESPESV